MTIVIVVGLIMGAFLYFAIISQNSNKSMPTLRINNQEIHIEIATTLQEKKEGLCCRNSLPERQGMLFVYDQPGDYGFWMKNTRIPLDMYWISAEKKIVHIEHSVRPDSYPQSFRSPIPAQYILETNAGFAKKHSITVGDQAEF